MSELNSKNCTRRLILTCIRNMHSMLVGFILTNFALFYFVFPTKAAIETSDDLSHLTTSKAVDILDIYGHTSEIDIGEMEERYLVIQRRIDAKLQVTVHY
jgi:hypothetical protein